MSKQVKYTESQLNRPCQKIISLCSDSLMGDPNYKVKDIKLCQEYNKKRGMKALIMPLDRDFAIDGMKKIRHSILMNWSAPETRICEHNTVSVSPNVESVVQGIAKRFKMGLCIMHNGVCPDTDYLKKIFSLEGTGVDFVCYYGSDIFALSREVVDEYATMLRFQFIEFTLDHETYTRLVTKFGEQVGSGIFVSIAYAQWLRHEINEALEGREDISEQKISELMATDVSYDLKNNRIYSVLPDSMDAKEKFLAEEIGIPEYILAELVKYEKQEDKA